MSNASVPLAVSGASRVRVFACETQAALQARRLRYIGMKIQNPKSKIQNRCVACGADAQRIGAKFCLVCGKNLREDYEPLDTFRAAHRLQGKNFVTPLPATPKTENLFEANKNTVSDTAWACLVYSFVPYLGILFVPLTLVVGSFAFYVSHREPHLGGRKLSLACVGLSFVVLAVQIFLWWLLYIVPELDKT